MPVWNRSGIVQRAIESVLNQMFQDFELLIIDDGSDDNLKEAVSPYLSDKVMYHWIEHQGVSAARNIGIQHARGRYIAYLDSDNVWHADFLEKMNLALINEKNGALFAYCKARRIRKDTKTGNLYDDGIIGDVFSYRRLIQSNYIDVNTLVHERSCLDVAGLWDISLRRLEDWDMLLRIGRYYEPAFVDEVLVDYYFCVEENTITEYEDHDSASASVVKKHGHVDSTVSIKHDTVVYTWNHLSDRKYNNWLRLQQPELNNADFTAWGYPYILQIEPSNTCNLSCELCPVGLETLVRPPRHMSLKEFQRIIDDLEDYLLLLVLWDWGEPFMNPDLPEMIQYAVERDIRTVTRTNGHFLLNAGYTERILQSGLSSLIVAVDSLEQEQYELFKKRGKLSRVLQGLELAVDLKAKTGSRTIINMRTVVTRNNEHEIEKLRTYAGQLGADHYSVKTLNPSVNPDDQDESLVPKNPAYQRFQYEPGTLRRIRANAPCRRVWTMSNIFSNGDVVPCCYDFSASMSVGNVNEKPLSEIWNGPTYRTLRSRIHTMQQELELCRACWVNYALSDTGRFVKEEGSAPEIKAPKTHVINEFNAVRDYFQKVNTDIQSRDDYIQMLHRSRSWRMTKLLRSGSSALKKLRTRNGTASPQKAGRLEVFHSQGNGPTPVRSLDAARVLFDQQSRVLFESFKRYGEKLHLPSPLNPELSVLIPVHNRVELLYVCLTYLKASIYQNFETVILDNGSSDETTEFYALLDGPHVIRNLVNKGFPAACNQMAEKAKGSYLLFLNSDAYVTPGALSEALRVMKSSSDVGAVGGKLISMDGTLQEAGCRVYNTGETQFIINNPDPFHYSNNEQRDVDYCSGAFLLTSRKVFKALGGFDQTFEYGYYEDVDYCFSLRERGLRTVYAPQAVVFHLKNGSQKSVEEASFLSCKNRDIFITNHLPAVLHQPCKPEIERRNLKVYNSSAGIEGCQNQQQERSAASNGYFHMMWHLNQACNFDCTYCFQDSVDLFRPGEHPFCGKHSPEHIAACFERTGKKWRIHMSGGEPFLYPDFVRLCALLSKNHVLSINTNLTTDTVFSWADVIPPDKVRSVNANLHLLERMKREGGCESFIEKMHYLQKKGFRVRMVYIAYPPLMERVEGDLEYFRSMGIALKEVKMFRGPYNGRIYPEAYTEQDRRLFRKLDLTQYERSILDGKTGFQGRPCTTGQNAFHMDVYGNITRCNTVQTQYGNLFLEEYGFDELPMPCPAESCGCPYQAYKFVLQ